MITQIETFSFNTKVPFQHIYLTDKNHVLKNCNQSQAITLGYQSIDEIIDKNIDELCSKEDIAPIIRNNEMVFRKKQALLFEEVIQLDEGTALIATSFKSPFKNEKNNIIGIMGMTTIIEKISPFQNYSSEGAIETAKLSPQQLKCFYLLLQGYNPKQIAIKLNLSHRTIEHYIMHIRLKLNCKNTNTLIARYANQLIQS